MPRPASTTRDGASLRPDRSAHALATKLTADRDRRDVQRVTAFLTRLFPDPRPFDIRLWEGSVIAGAGRPADGGITIVVNNHGAVRRMFRLPVELRLGEAFLHHDFDLEGDVAEAGPALERSRTAAATPQELLALARMRAGLPRGRRRKRARKNVLGEGPAELQAREWSSDWDREGISYHYDAGNDFYELFLDRRMVYTCAYYPTGRETLEEAQEAKLELVCRKLRLSEGQTVLDVGCGWGAFAIYAASKYGVRVTAVTLSREQQEWGVRRVAEAGLNDRVEIRFADYREVKDGPFDVVAAIGILEHIGPKRLDEYFKTIHGLIRPGGLFMNHSIAVRPAGRTWLRQAIEPLLVGGDNFRKRYIFPSGGLVSISAANEAAQQAGFEVRDVENLREHYVRTLHHWVERLEDRREDAIRIGGLGMYRLWRLYMGIAAWQFEIGDLHLGQTLLRRSDGRPSNLPPTRADLYRD